ncbi:transposase [Rufibacter psychrotolerans]|uniref:transposase n=1 Tax=Rufibacter psychrotolerans TaxID=2812556 RepID=UPI001967053D|nr:transposase [Rufibacter sp. SYSU D00308]
MAKYDSFSKKNRRLSGYDYRWEGLYFITICTQGREPIFGEVRAGKMILSDEGQIAHEYWLEIAQLWPRVLLGEFVVMPNHVHGIIGLEGHLENQQVRQESKPSEVPEKNEFMAALSPKAGSISRIINWYKGTCTKAIKRGSTNFFGWQPRFHDRIIRNQRELVLIENYIRDNPAKWQDDRFFKT